MTIEKVLVDAAEMKRDGEWFNTWIITNSDKPAMVSLAAIKNIHVETLIANAETFHTLPGDPKGVSVTAFCKASVPDNCVVALNLEQEGMEEFRVVKPNN
jgi:hypothetical protein